MSIKLNENMEADNTNQNIQSPKVSVNVIIDKGAGLIILAKSNDNPNWSLPGGILCQTKSAEEAAIEYAKAITNLDVELIKQFHVYSNPNRDPESNTISITFVAKVLSGEQKVGSTFSELSDGHQMNIPENLYLDHKQIIEDYFLQRY